jgi:hypothetical protein
MGLCEILKLTGNGDAVEHVDRPDQRLQCFPGTLVKCPSYTLPRARPTHT